MNTVSTCCNELRESVRTIEFTVSSIIAFHITYSDPFAGGYICLLVASIIHLNTIYEDRGVKGIIHGAAVGFTSGLMLRVYKSTFFYKP